MIELGNRKVDLGIDVSAHNVGHVSLAREFERGARVLHIRTGDGKDADLSVHGWIEDAVKVGFKYIGLYHYVHLPRSANEQWRDAKILTDVYQQYADVLNLRPAVDLENFRGASAIDASTSAKEFVTYVEDTLGMDAVIYTMQDFWAGMPKDTWLTTRDLWVSDLNGGYQKVTMCVDGMTAVVPLPVQELPKYMPRGWTTGDPRVIGWQWTNTTYHDPGSVGLDRSVWFNLPRACIPRKSFDAVPPPPGTIVGGDLNSLARTVMKREQEEKKSHGDPSTD